MVYVPLNYLFRPGKKGGRKAPIAPQSKHTCYKLVKCIWWLVTDSGARAVAKLLVNEEQPKLSGPIPIIPSPIPPTPMETPSGSTTQNPPVFPQQYNAPTSSYQANATNNSSGYVDYTSDSSPYNQRKIPNSSGPSIPSSGGSAAFNSGGPSLAEEILSSLRSSTTTTRNADGLPSTMLWCAGT